MRDVRNLHKYNKLCFSDAVAENRMIAIVVVAVGNESHFVVEMELNPIDDIVDDDDGIVEVDVGTVVFDDDVDVDVDDEKMVVEWEMDDDFVHFVQVEYLYHSIASLSDH